MARTPSEARARRLIALIGMLEPGSELSLSSLAAQLGTTAAELADDLVTLSMCGLAPYDPWVLVPVLVDGDRVQVFGETPAVRGPIRLSAAEARALSVALQAAGFTATDPLAIRLLAASSASFDAEGLEHVVRSAIDGHESSIYERLAHAVQDREVVTIEYVRAGDVDASCREVEPLALFAERGAWYVVAWCRKSAAWRTFRVDRIRSASVSGECFQPGRDSSPEDPVAFNAAGLPVARLRFASASEYVEREWPSSHVIEKSASGGLVAEVPFAGTAWLARMVASRLGAVVVESPEELRAATSALARGLVAELG